MLRTALTMVLAAAATAAWGQTLDLSLYVADIDSLPAPARHAYDEALDCNNHTDQVGTVEYLAEAAQAAPEVLELQWLLCQAAEAYVRADNFGLEGALEIAAQVVGAYGRIVASERLPPEYLPTVERYQMRLVGVLDNVDEIIAARREVGSAYMVQAAATREQAEAAVARYTARVREERAQNPYANRVSSGDSVQANPLLLPSRHYDHAQIRGSRDVVGATSSLILPSHYYD